MSGKDEDFKKEKFKLELKGYKETKNGKEKVYQKLEFPYYFIDFEYVGQVVPLIKNTRPLVPLLFQWSVHKWNSLDEEIKLEDGLSFLKFQEDDMEQNFIESLLKTVGETGTIFCHNAESAEITQLKNFKKYNFPNLADQIDELIKRSIDLNKISLHLHNQPNRPSNVGNIIVYALKKGIYRYDVSYMPDIGGCSVTMDSTHGNLSYDQIHECL